MLKNNENIKPRNVNNSITPCIVSQMAIKASHLKPHTAVPPALYSLANREINGIRVATCQNIKPFVKYQGPTNTYPRPKKHPHIHAAGQPLILSRTSMFVMPCQFILTISHLLHHKLQVSCNST